MNLKRCTAAFISGLLLAGIAAPAAHADVAKSGTTNCASTGRQVVLTGVGWRTVAISAGSRTWSKTATGSGDVTLVARTGMSSATWAMSFQNNYTSHKADCSL